jgi:sigma-B regulation protein RsbU (phosphoserine phosphatase)
MLSLNNNEAFKNLSALVDFSNLVNSNLDLELTVNNILLTCFGKFHTSKGIIALADDEQILRLKATKGINKELIADFPEIKIDGFENVKIFADYLDSVGIEISHLIESSGKKLGVLFLGKRLVGSNYEQEDFEFLNALLNIAATAIQNSISVDEIKKVNRNLDSKVNQLSSLFDLSKEFSSIIDSDRVGKLLIYSIIGQLMVTKFAVITLSEESFEILDSKYDISKLNEVLENVQPNSFTTTIRVNSDTENYSALSSLGVELIVPMQVKSKTKGLILLGNKIGNLPYSQSDIEYISSVGSLAIISLENARLFSETLEKERLEKDLQIAKNIQRNLLPNKIPKFKKFEIAAVNNSARQVGGDYYDIVKLDDNRTLIAIADVSGKGVQAALLMANLQAFLQSIAKQNLKLDEASNLINDLVSENTHDGSFITFFWGIIDQENMELTFVNMGHNPPLHIRDNKINHLKLGGMILGVMPTTIPYKCSTISINANDKLVLFTDGITEAMNSKGVDYTDERLEELCKSLGEFSAEQTLSRILEDVNNFTDGAQQSDDITAMVVKFK